MKFIKFTTLSILYLFIILGLEALLLMLASGALFNSITLPILNNIDFLILLIKSNIGSGLRELIAQPVLILGNSSAPNEYIAALYYYPVNSLLHILFAAFITSQVLKKPMRLIRLPFLIAGTMFLVSINYVWLAGCCGAVPGWTLDTMLLNYVFSTNVNSGTRMDFYELLYDWMTLLQIIMIFISVLLLRYATRYKK
ncbi:MAG: hypothetical protein KAT25_00585 [Sulfuriflexus sp.]|nr:hypothetical protein [Sulfuriflexus sp.]